MNNKERDHKRDEFIIIIPIIMKIIVVTVYYTYCFVYDITVRREECLQKWRLITNICPLNTHLRIAEKWWLSILVLSVKRSVWNVTQGLCSGSWQLAGFCGHGNEFPGSVNVGHLLTSSATVRYTKRTLLCGVSWSVLLGCVVLHSPPRL
jgi:hypothetical protein